MKGWKCFFVNTVVICLIAATTTCQHLASAAEIDNVEIGPNFTVVHPEVIDESGRPLNGLKGFGCGAPVLLADGRLMMVFGDDDKRCFNSDLLIRTDTRTCLFGIS